VLLKSVSALFANCLTLRFRIRNLWSQDSVLGDCRLLSANVTHIIANITQLIIACFVIILTNQDQLRFMILLLLSCSFKSFLNLSIRSCEAATSACSFSRAFSISFILREVISDDCKLFIVCSILWILILRDGWFEVDSSSDDDGVEERLKAGWWKWISSSGEIYCTSSVDVINCCWPSCKVFELWWLKLFDEERSCPENVVCVGSIIGVNGDMSFVGVE